MAAEASFSFVAIVVLYCTRPEDARTLTTFAACSGRSACRRLVVVDHGPASQSDEFAAFATARGLANVRYEHAPENPPLGQAYNRAIRAHLGTADYVLILDQDTALPPGFIASAAEGARQPQGAAPSLMAPNIRAGTRIASPCRLFLGWGRRWPAPRAGWQSLRSNTLINSGAWVHRRVFETLGVWYSERLRLYGIDTDFYKRLADVEARFWVLPMTIAHDLSFDSASIESKARKLDAMLSANRQIYSNEPVAVRAALRCLNALVRLKYSVRYASLRFL